VVEEWIGRFGHWRCAFSDAGEKGGSANFTNTAQFARDSMCARRIFRRLEAALNARAEALVTFNETHFSFAAKQFRLPLWHPAACCSN
jgi:hypothetical protein